jgi:hypothetical protein
MKAEEAEKTLGLGLCFRCENRSIFHETGYGPRFECKQKMAVNSCYCFIPCKPVAVIPITGEKRPIFGPWMIAGRVRAKGLIDAERLRLKLVDVGDGAITAAWIIKPKGKKKAK